MVRAALAAAVLAGGAWLYPSMIPALVSNGPTSNTAVSNGAFSKAPEPSRFAVALRHHPAPPPREAIVEPTRTRLDPRFTAPTLTAGTAADTITASLPRGATFEPSVVVAIASLETQPSDATVTPTPLTEAESAPLTTDAGAPLTTDAGAPLTEEPLNLNPLPRADAALPLPAVQTGLPLPLPRPRVARENQAQQSGRRSLARLTQAPAASADPRSLFDKFLGAAERPSTVLAYAAPEDGSPGLLTGARRATIDSRTAVYDIAAHTVTLPDGTRLEAHSGLGPSLDNPRSVTEHMRGATPPNVYELTPREALFHGVAALRLTPVGGTTYGRGGLLAHTYMLGPRGDSNGCVVFRDYKTFRRAFDTGQIRRLVVVARVG